MRYWRLLILCSVLQHCTRGHMCSKLPCASTETERGPAAIRRPLYKTLVHGLREVNPEAAAMLEASPRLRNPTKRNTLDRMVMSMAKVSISGAPAGITRASLPSFHFPLRSAMHSCLSGPHTALLVGCAVGSIRARDLCGDTCQHHL